MFPFRSRWPRDSPASSLYPWRPSAYAPGRGRRSERPGRPTARGRPSRPARLQRLPWVLWRAEPRPGDKPAKVPYQIADLLRRASSTDSDTWGIFADAVEAYSALAGLPADPERGPVAGIGVVLTPEARITCVDLDRVLHGTGTLGPGPAAAALLQPDQADRPRPRRLAGPDADFDGTPFPVRRACSSGTAVCGPPARFATSSSGQSPSATKQRGGSRS
jgi:hypothetical protein